MIKLTSRMVFLLLIATTSLYAARQDEALQPAQNKAAKLVITDRDRCNALKKLALVTLKTEQAHRNKEWMALRATFNQEYSSSYKDAIKDADISEECKQLLRSIQPVVLEKVTEDIDELIAWIKVYNARGRDLHKHQYAKNAQRYLPYWAECGYEEVVQKLINAKCDINAKDSKGNTALMMAAYAGHEKLVNVLIAAGARIEDKNGQQDARDLAREGGHNEIALLLDNAAYKVKKDTFEKFHQAQQQALKQQAKRLAQEKINAQKNAQKKQKRALLLQAQVAEQERIQHAQAAEQERIRQANLVRLQGEQRKALRKQQEEKVHMQIQQARKQKNKKRKEQDLLGASLLEAIS